MTRTFLPPASWAPRFPATLSRALLSHPGASFTFSIMALQFHGSPSQPHHTNALNSFAFHLPASLTDTNLSWVNHVSPFLKPAGQQSWRKLHSGADCFHYKFRVTNGPSNDMLCSFSVYDPQVIGGNSGFQLSASLWPHPLTSPPHPLQLPLSTEIRSH